MGKGKKKKSLLFIYPRLCLEAEFQKWESQAFYTKSKSFLLPPYFFGVVTPPFQGIRFLYPLYHSFCFNQDDNSLTTKNTERNVSSWPKCQSLSIRREVMMALSKEGEQIESSGLLNSAQTPPSPPMLLPKKKKKKRGKTGWEFHDGFHKCGRSSCSKKGWIRLMETKF
jgi:hypothetical protein